MVSHRDPSAPPHPEILKGPVHSSTFLTAILSPLSTPAKVLKGFSTRLQAFQLHPTSRPTWHWDEVGDTYTYTSGDPERALSSAAAAPPVMGREKSSPPGDLMRDIPILASRPRSAYLKLGCRTWNNHEAWFQLPLGTAKGQSCPKGTIQWPGRSPPRNLVGTTPTMLLVIVQLSEDPTVDPEVPVPLNKGLEAVTSTQG